MLPHQHRLTRSRDFGRVIRSGRRAATSTVVVHALPVGPDEAMRVGFAVSRAVGTAVTRNRVKRRLRHILGSRLATGQFLVVRANPAAAEADYARLSLDVDRCLARLKDRAA